MDKKHLQRGKAAAYHSHDFDFESVVPDGGLHTYLNGLTMAEEGTTSDFSLGSKQQVHTLPAHCTSAQQADDWETFHAKTHGRFFKPRMFLLLEFPCLTHLKPGELHPSSMPGADRLAQGATDTVHLQAAAAASSEPPKTRMSQAVSPAAPAPPPLPAVWEVGCGAGSNVLPLLHHTEHPIMVFASDYSAAAVHALQEHEQFDAQRCPAFVLDVVKNNLQDGNQVACLQYPCGVQAVTATFLLSAIHPSEQPSAMRNMSDSLAPGGLLCFRDYGVFDHAMMRFKPSALEQGGRVGALFRRADGTLAHYFSVDDVRELCEGAGLEVLELEYACVMNRNRKKGTEMRRVFVHALARKKLCVTDE